MSDIRPLLVTSALPYANGPPHFGHLSGAYLPADVFVRYHRMIGSDVAYVCGTDEHGVAITLSAEQAGVPYQEYVDGWHAVWLRACEKLGIEFDNFSQTSRREPHFALSTEFFLRCLKNGHVVRRDIEQLYSPKTDRFLADRYVVGTCYVCGYEEARGDECPNCGSWLEAPKLQNPRSKLDPDDALELRASWQYEFELGPFADDPHVKPWLEQFRGGLKPNVVGFVFDKMIEGEGLEARPITRDLPWGIPLPKTDLDGNDLGDVEGKVLYVWFDAPIGYISSTIEWAEREGKDWRRYWIVRDGEPEPRLVHFIGKDNITFHCILFPAMLAWQGLDNPPAEFLGPKPGERYALPENVPANEFYNLEHKKFSKSSGWYIDVERHLEKYGADRTRFYLISSMPETADTNFIWHDFKARTDLLANVFGNFATRILKFVDKHFEGKVPPRVGMDAEWAEVQAAIEKQVGEVAEHIEAYRFRKALDAFLGLAEHGNLYLDKTAPWKLRKTDMEACGTALHIALQYLPALSVLAEPFIPGVAAKLRGMLNLEARAPGSILPTELLATGHALGEPGVLCEKVDPDEIELELAELNRRSSEDAAS
ncbi:MAG: methionine--tRNA ligase [Planctomycetota bacterium]